MFVINVDLLTKFAENINKFWVGGVGVSQNKAAEQLIEVVGRDLLLGIAQCGFGIDVRFNHYAVKVEVKRLLRYFVEECTRTADVAGVADDWQMRNSSP